MSFKTEVQNILGDATAADTSHVAHAMVTATNAEKVVEDALWDLANLLPPELLLSTAENIADASASYLLDKETRVLLIERQDTVGDSLMYPCKEVPYHQHTKYIDPLSIYLATNLDPIWYKEGNTSDAIQKYGKINIFPSVGASTNIWIYEKAVVSKCTSGTTVDPPDASDNNIWFWDGASNESVFDDPNTYYNYAIPHFFPAEAHLALKLLIATRLANQYLVEFAINEEDSEVLSLVKGAIEAIDSEFKIQMNRLGANKEKETA